ncbi:RNA cytidine acetyltransferase [Anopheles funestus]|uniref:RNA cytidine acetyltransferase n=1 Tax=Anopheles funestus TaxID=62324 RepID=UPI0020C633C6|nr:RNA cytidine acetyltransferase [Anopheles funestus]
MVKKKIDNRIRVMIENGVKMGHRTMFVIVGNKARDQVPILYDILTKASVKARPTVLWCYKNKDEAISNHGKKRAKKIQAGKIDINESDLFDAFRVATTIHGRYYKDTHTILGKTYGVCVLQDFEALTPNLLARTVETVEGGGLIILLLKTISSLKQIYTMSMDVHKRYRTEAHQNVTCRFNERLILSLADCSRCLLVNDDLTVLPLSSRTADVKAIDVASIESSHSEQLAELKESLADAPPAGPLVSLCRTYDQAKAVAQFIDALAEKQLKPPTSLTAGRGRGKSAAMGLAIAGSIAFGYVNVYVTSPSPENLITLFEFILKGFDVLEYQEHTDYTIIRSTNPNFNKAIIRINVTRNNRQTIQYISPTDAHLLNAADLLIIDEAAAIPLPMVKAMIGSYLVFMASTINGYEGTGRSLSLKLLSQLQKENNAPQPIKLDESIRYSPGDPVESWLTSLLCLDATIVQNLNSGCPPPDECQLYYVDRDALFSYHRAAETFLQRIVSICVSSHYKNSPNDLQMMSDAPSHHLFCLLGPIVKKNQLPEILVVIQVCLEGEISSRTMQNSLVRGMKASGDLIPWNIAEQFGDHEFPKLSGARIVRIATHPNYQRMGYGKRALNQLKLYYEGKFPIETDGFDDDQGNDNGIETIDDEDVDLLKEVIAPRKKIPTLLKSLTERRPELLDYLGASFGLTGELLRFWKSQKFVPVYLSQKENDLTGEHSCILLCPINSSNERVETNEWLNHYFYDFRRRVLKLLGKAFKKFPTSMALSLLENRAVKIEGKPLTQTTIDEIFLPHDIQRLEMYINSQVEYKLIWDLTTDLGSLYFQDRMAGAHLETLHKAILLGCGLQNKSIDQMMDELNMPSNQVLAKFFDCMKKVTNYMLRTMENTIEGTMAKPSELNMGDNLMPLKQSLNEEFEEDVKTLEKQQKKELTKLKKLNLDQYAIKGTDEEWNKVLSKTKSTIVSIKSGEKRLNESVDESNISSGGGDVSAFQKKKAKFGKKQKTRNSKG